MLMPSVPIACTLAPDGVADRMEEWRTFLSTMVTKVEQVTNQATLTLLRDGETLVVATDLAEREKACCPFFQFSIEVDAFWARLLVGVPLGAEGILTGLLTVSSPRPSTD
jgi:hypothetical protein